MYRRVKSYIEQYQMIQPGMTVVVGLSGGGDSVALLSLLRKYQTEQSFSLRALHVQHGIRGEEAKRDAAFAGELCEKWHIPCSIYEYDVPLLAKKRGLGIEETGRLVRREAFEEEQRRLGVSDKQFRIALAHNKNDVAETVLHNLARGSGIRGLCSMSPVSGQRIRPVMCLERGEIEHYLKEKQISYVTDSTNLSDAYTRNRIRRNILPALTEQVNVQAVAHIAETSAMLGQAEAYFSRAGRALSEKFRLCDGGYEVECSFASEEEILQQYAVQEMFAQLSGSRKDFTGAHVKAVCALFDRQVGKQAALPYGLTAVRTYRGVRLFSETKRENLSKKEGVQQNREWELPVPGCVQTPYGTFSARIFPWRNEKIIENQCTKWLDYDKIEKDLCVRTRKEGDYLIIDREGKRKKLSRIWIDEKIPREQREEIPLVVCGEEILWIAAGRMSERYKITAQTRCVLELNYQGGKSHE